MSSRAHARLARVVGQLRPDHKEQTAAVEPSATRGNNQPVRVLITGAAGNIAYSAIFAVGQGQMLGDQPIELRLLDIPPMAKKLQGVEMEVRDCAFPLVKKIVATTDYKTAFENVDVALLVGAKPRGNGMDRKDLLADNGKIFAGQGKALNAYASRNVKVIVVGNPANTNALLAMLNAPDIPKENFTAMTRLDQNRAVSLLSERLGASVTDIDRVVIWGNHSKTQYPDVNHATVGGRAARSVVRDDKWLNGEFISTVQQRGSAIIKARGLSSAASAANAAIDHARDWLLGTAPGKWVSMGVPSDGSYGVPEGIIYSFPVTCTAGGNYKIVQGLKVDSFSRGKMEETAKELLEEKEFALRQS